MRATSNDPGFPLLADPLSLMTYRSDGYEAGRVQRSVSAAALRDDLGGRRQPQNDICAVFAIRLHVRVSALGHFGGA